MALALGVLGGCSPEAAPGLQATEGWGTSAYKLIMGGCRQEPSGAFHVVLSKGCSLMAAGFPQGRWRWHTWPIMAYYGLVSDSHTVTSHSSC